MSSKRRGLALPGASFASILSDSAVHVQLPFLQGKPFGNRHPLAHFEDVHHKDEVQCVRMFQTFAKTLLFMVFVYRTGPLPSRRENYFQKMFSFGLCAPYP